MDKKNQMDGQETYLLVKKCGYLQNYFLKKKMNSDKQVDSESLC